MARHTKMKVLNSINDIGVVPVFYNGDIDILKNVAKSCAAGGILLLEFTNRGDHAWEVFSQLEKFCSKNLPEVILGAGSIVDAGTASMYISSGANFIVGPVTNFEVAKVCNRRKIPYMPGCGTASEISNAQEQGADIVKIFPGSAVGGPSFVKDILGPMPWSDIMPTGGVDITEESLKPWFDSGVVAVGMGSKFISNDIIKDKNWDLLKERSLSVCKLAKRLKEKKG